MNEKLYFIHCIIVISFSCLLCQLIGCGADTDSDLSSDILQINPAKISMDSKYIWQAEIDIIFSKDPINLGVEPEINVGDEYTKREPISGITYTNTSYSKELRFDNEGIPAVTYSGTVLLSTDWKQTGNVVTLYAKFSRCILYARYKKLIETQSGKGLPTPRFFINHTLTWNTAHQRLNTTMKPPRDVFYFIYENDEEISDYDPFETDLTSTNPY